MTRAEIESAYTVENGRITSPGKFESQPVYAPYYYDIYLNGFADGDDGEVLLFGVTPDDRTIFPEIPRNKRVIHMVIDDAGFVNVY